MGLDITLGSDDGRPLYRQIAGAVSDAVRAGRLRAGQRLPTVRELATTLGVTRPTVHRAYAVLAEEGWTESTVGRGTFVRADVRDDRPWRRIRPDRVMRDIQCLGNEPGLVSLAHAEPDPELGPVEAFWSCLEATRAELRGLLHYVSAQGDAALRERLAEMLAGRGLDVGASDVIVTSGVTQGLSLAVQVLTRAGDAVLVEQPTYLGLIQILEEHGRRAVGVPVDDEGPNLDVLAAKLADERPRLLYTIPSFHNPTGRCMSPARRAAVLQLAARHAVPVVEDDVYRALAYDGAPPPPMLGSEAAAGAEVWYLDGFSKLAMPGVRIGFLIAPVHRREAVLARKRASDLCGSPLLQRALANFVADGHVERHLRRVRPRYRKRRDALLAALAERMPAGVTWSQPAGGFCVWLDYPGSGGGVDIYRKALDRGVVVAPGEVFQVAPDDESHIRLTFGSNKEATLRRAAAVLGEVVAEHLGGVPPATDATPIL